MSQRSLGKYHPIAELGRGGMATVYLAASRGPRGFTKLVVIKELKDDLAYDPEFSGMFVDEARLAARLSHPNIVQTNEVVEEEGHFYIVMEWLEGQALSAVRTRLSRLGQLTREHQLRVLVDMLEGLHHAHELRDYDGTPLHVVHRDVSPHNVFVTYNGAVKLVDFGIAKTADSSSQTRTGVIKGKVAYMAPEQAFGEKVDRRADVFSAGVILWEALTGRRMWKGMPEAAIIHRLSTGDLPRVTDGGAPPAPGNLQAVVERALAKRPEDRYPTALAMKQDLEAYLAALRERPTARAFGGMVAQAFSEERARIAALVEEQMRPQRTTRPDELPRVASPGVASVPPPAPEPGTGSASGALAVGATVRPPAPGPDADDDEGPSVRTLTLAGIGLVLLGAAATTVFMAPWSRPASAAAPLQAVSLTPSASGADAAAPSAPASGARR